MSGLSDLLCDVARYGQRYFRETDPARLAQPFAAVAGLKDAFEARNMKGFITSLADYYNRQGQDILAIRVPMGPEEPWSLLDIARSEGNQDVMDILQDMADDAELDRQLVSGPTSSTPSTPTLN